MTQRFSTMLFEPSQANQALTNAWKWVKPFVFAGHRFSFEIKPETRSTAQNRLLHSRISDVAAQKEWAGKRRDVDTWKRLLTAAWLRARGESVELLPALDGHGVDVVFRRTSSLTVAECAELADYILAWGDGEGLNWSQTSLGRDFAMEVAA